MTAYKRILDALRANGRSVREYGSQARAQCPGHDGSNPTALSIRRQPGRARLKCFVGCDDVDILKAVALEVGDLFDDRREVRYPYEDGWTVYRSWDTKAGKKKIRQEGPKASGQKSPEAQQTQLYKLSETKAAVADHRLIILVEGEDNADLINSLPEDERGGGFATTARMGADSFHLCDVEPLRGAKVIAVVDRDEGGDGWARQVRAKLKGVVGSLDFTRSKVGQEKADAADHIMAGYSLDQLEPYVFPTSLALAQLRTGDWLDVQVFPPLSWVVEGVIPQGFTLLVGAPKLGKSWMALGIALALARGGYAFGKIKCGQRPVLLLALEDSHRRMQERLRKLLGPWERIPAGFHYLTTLDAHVITTIEDWLETVDADAGPVVILDTIGKVIPPALRGEGAYEGDYRFSGALQRVTKDHTSVSLIGLHHNRKATADDFVETISGTHGLGGAADTIIVINRERNKREGVLKVAGRDVEENEYAIEMVDLGWVLGGGDLSEAADAAEMARDVAKLGDLSSRIVTYVDEHQADAFTPSELAGKLGEKAEKVQRYLYRLAGNRKIGRRGRGVYVSVRSASMSAASGVSASDKDPDTSDTTDTNPRVSKDFGQKDAQTAAQRASEPPNPDTETHNPDTHPDTPGLEVSESWPSRLPVGPDGRPLTAAIVPETPCSICGKSRREPPGNEECAEGELAWPERGWTNHHLCPICRGEVDGPPSSEKCAARHYDALTGKRWTQCAACGEFLEDGATTHPACDDGGDRP